MEVKTPKYTLEHDAEYLEKLRSRVVMVLDVALEKLNGDDANALFDAVAMVEQAQKSITNAYAYLWHEIERVIKWDN